MRVRQLFQSVAVIMFAGLTGCNIQPAKYDAEIFPVIITETTLNDTDDPAIWYNASDPSKSLILGTDKGDKNGGIFVFDLDGKLLTDLSIYNLQRPNNIDIEYGYQRNNELIDIAVFTERGRDMIRVISLPDCRFIDDGGIPVFVGEEIRSPMGIALYKNPSGDVYAIVGRKDGPDGSYLHQYRLFTQNSVVKAEKVRSFGQFSGKKEIEAIAVDDEAGYIYYSDETVGIKKYHADPSKGNELLALFGENGFKQDHEGISIFKGINGKRFVVVSDQQSNLFRIFTATESVENPHNYQLVRVVKVQTNESDGSDLLQLPLNQNFPHGIFVAMSDNRTFHLYKLDELLGPDIYPASGE